MAIPFYKWGNVLPRKAFAQKKGFPRLQIFNNKVLYLGRVSAAVARDIGHRPQSHECIN